LEAGEEGHAAAAALAATLGGPPPAQVDSQAKYALVARGDAEVYVRFPKRPGEHGKVWDHAAGALVATESGATVTDLLGRPLDFSLGCELSANEGLVVSNGLVHERVLTAIGSPGRPGTAD
jgi:3'(2'), 5'-bisphosphate nucleotidase